MHYSKVCNIFRDLTYPRILRFHAGVPPPYARDGRPHPRVRAVDFACQGRLSADKDGTTIYPRPVH